MLSLGNMRGAAKPFVPGVHPPPNSRDSARPITSSPLFKSSVARTIDVWKYHVPAEHVDTITELHNLSLSEGSQAFEKLPEIRKVEQACPVCPCDTFNQPTVCQDHPALSDRDKTAGLPGVVVRVPLAKDIDRHSYVFQQEGKNDSGFGHPALIVHQSACGHMVYCLPLTSFGRNTLLQKYERCGNLQTKWEVMTDYVAIEHQCTEPHNDLGVLPLNKAMDQQTYAHLDFGFWIEWQFLEHFCKANKPKTDKCTCQRSILGEEWRQKIRRLAAINMTERALKLRKRSKNLVSPHKPVQSPPWQRNQQQQQRASGRREYPRHRQDQRVERSGPSFSDIPGPPGPQLHWQEDPPQHHRSQHEPMPRRYGNHPFYQDQRTWVRGPSSDDFRNAPGLQRRSRSPPRQRSEQQQPEYSGRQDGQNPLAQLYQEWRSSPQMPAGLPRWEGQWRKTSGKLAARS